MYQSFVMCGEKGTSMEDRLEPLSYYTCIEMITSEVYKPGDGQSDYYLLWTLLSSVI